MKLDMKIDIRIVSETDTSTSSFWKKNWVQLLFLIKKGSDTVFDRWL